MQCRSRPLGVCRTRSPKNATKFSDLGRVGDPAGNPPSWTSRAAKSTAVPLRLYSNSRRTGLPGMAGLVGIDPRLGLHARLLVDAPHHGIFGRVEVETTHVGGLGPKVGVVRSHPGLDLPGLEVQGLADPPGLRGRDRPRHDPPWPRPAPPWSSGLPRRVAVLGHQLHQEQHVVVVKELTTRVLSFMPEIAHISRPNLRALIGTGRHRARRPHVERYRKRQDLRHGLAWGI